MHNGGPFVLALFLKSKEETLQKKPKWRQLHPTLFAPGIPTRKVGGAGVTCVIIARQKVGYLWSSEEGTIFENERGFALIIEQRFGWRSLGGRLEQNEAVWKKHRY